MLENRAAPTLETPRYVRLKETFHGPYDGPEKYITYVKAVGNRIVEELTPGQAFLRGLFLRVKETYDYGDFSTFVPTQLSAPTVKEDLRNKTLSKPKVPHRFPSSANV